MSTDELFMRRAIELARNGAGRVSPNPMVGCVIARAGNVIGEGWHREYGGPHAEVHAVNSVPDPALLRGSTVYVNLEPCSHQGKTPPCADLLVRSAVGRVVVANADPNPLVSGKGLEMLRQAGISVEAGLLAEEGEALNARFFTFHRLKRPYIVLKWAETADGYLARDDGSSKWISGAASRILVHKWRAEEDAVLVGSNTALTDDPQLSVRDWMGRQPLRLLIDRHLRLQGRALRLFDGRLPTVCYNLSLTADDETAKYVSCREEVFLEDLLADLCRRQVLSVMVEGGAAVLGAFIGAGLWDEARVFRCPVTFGSGTPAPRLLGASHAERHEVVSDELWYYKR
jgi:diaminohydroxyphosphoribosylaminopyrimidine deaminase / 5-amino-6-(5-phosphoribosylamino)uracil reductase